MSETCVIRCADLRLFLPNFGAPKNVAAMIKAARYRSCRNLGGMMFDLVAMTSTTAPSVEGELLISLVAENPRCDYVYDIFFDSVKVNNGLLFSGGYQAFYEWASKHDDRLQRYLYKKVAFKYAGGSRPRQERIVRVEAVTTQDKGRFILEGYDLQKEGSLKLAYRKYFSDRIIGDITLKNENG